MEEKYNRPLLDSLVDSKELQILKTIIPYMERQQQKQLAMTVRFIEFMKTTELFEDTQHACSEDLQACSGESEWNRLSKILNAVKDFFNEKERENIDIILNVIEMSK